MAADGGWLASSVLRRVFGWYNQESHGGYSSVAERRSVDPDVVGSTPTSRPKKNLSREHRAVTTNR